MKRGSSPTYTTEYLLGASACPRRALVDFSGLARPGLSAFIDTDSAVDQFSGLKSGERPFSDRVSCVINLNFRIRSVILTSKPRR